MRSLTMEVKERVRRRARIRRQHLISILYLWIFRVLSMVVSLIVLYQYGQGKTGICKCIISLLFTIMFIKFDKQDLELFHEEEDE